MKILKNSTLNFYEDGKLATADYLNSPLKELIDNDIAIEEYLTTNGGNLHPVSVNSDSELIKNKLYFIDSSNGQLNLTLPSTVEDDGVIVIFDFKNSFEENPITINAPDGYTVDGQSSLVLNENGTYLKLQILNPENDKNWYPTLLDSSVIDCGEF